MKITDWRIEAITGYKPITTYYQDFSIAEPFGTDAIRDTYTRAMETWGSDYKVLTEIVMVLNWKIWEHYDKGDTKLSKLYESLYFEADAYAVEHLKGEGLSYFYSTTD